jgi:hypothetical protein
MKVQSRSFLSEDEENRRGVLSALCHSTPRAALAVLFQLQTLCEVVYRARGTPVRYLLWGHQAQPSHWQLLLQCHHVESRVGHPCTKGQLLSIIRCWGSSFFISSCYPVPELKGQEGKEMGVGIPFTNSSGLTFYLTEERYEKPKSVECSPLC